jgi:hypothetical protein
MVGTQHALPLELSQHAEALLVGAITTVLTSRCGGDTAAAAAAAAAMIEVATESILADVLDDGVPGDVAAARDRFEPILFSCELSTSDDDDEVEGDGSGEGEAMGGGGLYADLHSAIARAVLKVEEPKPAPCTYTLHPTPYTLHPTPCTLHPAP